MLNHPRANDAVGCLGFLHYVLDLWFHKNRLCTWLRLREFATRC